MLPITPADSGRGAQRMPKLIRVAVVDDHPLFREGVVATVNAAPEFEVVAQGKCGSDAVHIARQQCPDIMLLDVNMSDGGIDAARKIKTLRPSVKTVMLTSCDDSEHMAAACAAGARKFIVKGTSATELVATLRAVHQAA
jgi:two-component system, NarL family, nitrate/nitrite response regulator NarL